MAAGFADKFDRKKFLLFFYTGFLLGTFLCAIAPNYHFLLMARIVTGLFGGVIGSVSFAIIGDLFKMEVRGRVMDFCADGFCRQPSPGSSYWSRTGQSFWLACALLDDRGFWFRCRCYHHIYMKPVTDHLNIKSDQKNPFPPSHKDNFTISLCQGILSKPLYLQTGGFMLMPFGSAFGSLILVLRRPNCQYFMGSPEYFLSQSVLLLVS